MNETAYLYETHMHTSPASYCAGASPAEQAAAYKARGYTGIIVTDHFFNGNSGCPPGLPWEDKIAFFSSGYSEAKREGELCGLDVFFGLEYSVRGTEFLTYGLSPELLREHPGLDGLTVEEYSAFVRGHGGFLAQAHPYRTARWIQNPFPVAPSLIDAVEVYNAGMSDRCNEKALQFARIHHLPMQAGSDSHYEDAPLTSGIALAKKADSITDVIEAIKARRAELILPDRVRVPPV